MIINPDISKSSLILYNFSIKKLSTQLIFIHYLMKNIYKYTLAFGGVLLSPVPVLYFPVYRRTICLQLCSLKHIIRNPYK